MEMKTDSERKQIIDAINILLNDAYDSTLEEIFTLLKKNEEDEDEDDLKAYDEAKEYIRENGTVSWEEVKNEISAMKKDVA